MKRLMRLAEKIALFFKRPPRRVLYDLSPLLGVLFFALFFLGWHLSLIAVAAHVTFRELTRGLAALFLLYAAVSVLLVVLLTALGKIVNRMAAWRRFMYCALAVLFILCSLPRVLDWGTVYFGGQHVDNVFWYHAFYADGTSFVLTLPSLVLMIALIATVAVFLWVLRLLFGFYVQFAAVRKKRREGASSGPSAAIIAAVNAACVAVLLACGGIVYCAAGEARPAHAAKAMFVQIPEIKVIGSFIDYTLKPEVVQNARLDESLCVKLEKCGIRLYSVDENYPLLKRSIYIEPKNAVADKPRIDTKTNIIIVFAESMSQFFLREDIHGIKGLTPAFHDLMSAGYTFTNMYNADYPTLRGMIATLGSSLYTIEKVRGIQQIKGENKMKGVRPPILSKFLFLSDVLKKYGYYSVQLQGGSGTFVSMKSAFTKRQSYDEFYSSESLELLSYAQYAHNIKSWGVRDEDVFRFGVKLLEEKRLPQPFLLTISTLDLHPPYTPLRTHPNARGNNLLNCLYSTDRAFAVLWEYLKRSAYRDNTLVLVVADHAVGPNAEYLDFVGRYVDYNPSGCDFIACAMYIPGNAAWRGGSNATVCSNLDIAPTLLDMMGVDAENPFLGLSIFSERPRYPLPITNYYINNTSFIMNRFSEKARNAVQLLRWTENDQKAFSEFLRSIALQRAIVRENTHPATEAY